MEGNGFYLRDGFWFKRLDDGSVRIRITEVDHADVVVREIVVPENEWASVVASVSARGESYETWQDARKLHGG